GHDTDLALVRRDDAGTVRADQQRIGVGQRRTYAQHVQHRNVFGNADNQLDAGIGGFQNGVGGEWRRRVNHAGVSTGCGDRFTAGIEYRYAQMLLTATARRDTADQLRAIGLALFGMEAALAAGNALADDLGVL